MENDSETPEGVGVYEAMARAAGGEQGVVDRDGFTWHPNTPPVQPRAPRRHVGAWWLAVLVAVVALGGIGAAVATSGGGCDAKCQSQQEQRRIDADACKIGEQVFHNEASC